jgi:hypothetical protein
MTPYRSRACVDIDDPSPKGGSEGFSGGGCPTCLSCVERSAEARRARKRSRWAAFFGTLAALALVATTVASFRGLQIAHKAMARHDRREARRAAKDLARAEKLQAILEHSPMMAPSQRQHHHHHDSMPPGPRMSTMPMQSHDGMVCSRVGVLGVGTHDPLELRRRAAGFAKTGLPVLHAQIPGASLLKLLAVTPNAISLTPVTTGGQDVGVKLGSVTAPLTATGLRDGDVLVSLNGSDLRRASDLEPALQPSLKLSPHVAVLEILRAGRPTILDVTFSD